jgi:hypothetical protein
MIIFDLDTLSDCDHRRHFIEAKGTWQWMEEEKKYISHLTGERRDKIHDWESFYEACDKDKAIESVISIWDDQISLGKMGQNQIWSGRCKSIREKTEKWLEKNLLCFESHQLKMRPIGDDTPYHILKEHWLNEQCSDVIEHYFKGKKYPENHNIDFVFDSDPESIKMWRRRGIFIFDCNQSVK